MGSSLLVVFHTNSLVQVEKILAKITISQKNRIYSNLLLFCVS
jgi:hypothetical protein